MIKMRSFAALGVVYLCVASWPAGAEAVDMLAAPEQSRVISLPPLRLAESTRLSAFVEMSSAAVGAEDELAALAAWNQMGNLPERAGFVRPLPILISFRAERSATAWLTKEVVESDVAQGLSGSLVWGTSVYVTEASRLRLKLENVSVPEGTKFWVWGEGDTPRVFGLELLTPDGVLWTPSVAGPTLYIEAEIPGSQQASVEPLTIAAREVAQIFDLTRDGLPVLEQLSEGPYEVTSCLIDAACVSDATYPNISLIKKAVAHMQYVKEGQIYICTGSMLNNTRTDFTPYFLTANHCISSQAVASTLETFWDFIDTSCLGTAPPLASLPRTTGSTLLVTSASSDYTLVRLSSKPSGRVFLGWSTTPVGSGPLLYRLHHPHGFPMSYSTSTATSSSGCGASSASFLFSDPAPELGQGQATPGSSGSAVLSSVGAVVGQLHGGCAANVNEPCLFGPGDFIYDGRFSAEYAALAPYLAPAGGDTSPCVRNTNTACLWGGRIEVRVDYNFAPANPPAGAADILYLGPERGETDVSSFWWFFDPANFEMGVKINPACDYTGNIWIYISGLTNAGYTVRLRDSVTGNTKTYSNPEGNYPQTIGDTGQGLPCF